ncbi:MAG: aspartate kinase, partial [Nitrosopumilaceae archaeon]
MNKLVVAKFGGSALGADGISIPIIIQRINALKKDAKILAVFSAPLTLQDGKTKSLTDLVLEIGNKAEKGEEPNLAEIKSAYEKILELVSSEYRGDCKLTIDSFLEKSKSALDEAKKKGEFTDEVRSRALAYSGEILMSHVMN